MTLPDNPSHRQLEVGFRNGLIDGIMLDPASGERNGRGPCAFTAVIDDESGLPSLGLAVANERGYHPVSRGWARYPSWELASADATRLNTSIGHDTDTADRIIASSMGGHHFRA